MIGGVMQKLIIIKYGELTTKKDNINFFLSTLQKNIVNTLNEIDAKITYDVGRMFIEVKDNDLKEVTDKLKNVFGIHEIVIGYKDQDLSMDALKANTLNLLQDKSFTTFKIEVKRSNKEYPLTSVEIGKEIGGYILKNKNNIKVDVNNPEMLFTLEIRRGEVLYYSDGYQGLGGYPVGTLGKGLLMLSGGIDSPVAGFMAIKRGIKIEAIYFESPPHTSMQAKNKVQELAKILAKYNANIKLHVINFTHIQEEILKNIPHEYLITIMRRMMYRISAIVASRSKCHIIVNGESIGQVASQTLTSMKCINEVVKLPVIRPLACFDKLEIIALAKKIGTYETSILPYEDCCTIFVPKHPVINPSLEKCYLYEKNINWEQMIYEAIKNHEVITIKSSDDLAKFKDIL